MGFICQYQPKIFDTRYPTLLFLTPPPKSQKIELIVTLGNNQNFEVVPKQYTNFLILGADSAYKDV